MRVLVTSAAGSLGQSLCSALQSHNHEVIPVDHRESGRMNQIYGRGAEVDLVKLEPNAIFHLEWSGSVAEADAEPAGMNLKNLASVHHALEAATALNCPLFFASTAGVYKGTLERPTKEDEDLEPVTHYGVHKLQAESLIRIYALRNQTKSVNLRLSNLFGAQSTKPSQIVPSLLNRIQEDLPVRITGDGKQVRDLIPYDFASEILVRFLSAELEYGTAYNVGSGIGTSIIDLVQMFYKVAGKEPQIEWMPSVSGARGLILDMNRTRSLIGEISAVNIELELEKIWNYTNPKP